MLKKKEWLLVLAFYQLEIILFWVIFSLCMRNLDLYCINSEYILWVYFSHTTPICQYSWFHVIRAIVPLLPQLLVEDHPSPTKELFQRDFLKGFGRQRSHISIKTSWPRVRNQTQINKRLNLHFSWKRLLFGEI